MKNVLAIYTSTLGNAPILYLHVFGDKRYPHEAPERSGLNISHTKIYNDQLNFIVHAEIILIKLCILFSLSDICSLCTIVQTTVLTVQ